MPPPPPPPPAAVDCCCGERQAGREGGGRTVGRSSAPTLRRPPSDGRAALPPTVVLRAGVGTARGVVRPARHVTTPAAPAAELVWCAADAERRQRRRRWWCGQVRAGCGTVLCCGVLRCCVCAGWDRPGRRGSTARWAVSSDGAPDGEVGLTQPVECDPQQWQ